MTSPSVRKFGSQVRILSGACTLCLHSRNALLITVRGWPLISVDRCTWTFTTTVDPSKLRSRGSTNCGLETHLQGLRCGKQTQRVTISVGSCSRCAAVGLFCCVVVVVVVVVVVALSVAWQRSVGRICFYTGYFSTLQGQDMIQLINFGFTTALDTRVESFCMEKSGHDFGLDSAQHFLGDQGSVFFLPNMTYAQPPACVCGCMIALALFIFCNAWLKTLACCVSAVFRYVHQMIHNATSKAGWTVLNTSVVGNDGVLAAASMGTGAEDALGYSTTALLLLNSNAEAVNITIIFDGASPLNDAAMSTVGALCCCE